MADNTLFSICMLLVLAGFVIGILALVIAILRSARGAGESRGGGLIMIGPVPIVFGTDKQSARVLMLLGIVLMFLLVVLSLIQILWR